VSSSNLQNVAVDLSRHGELEHRTYELELRRRRHTLAVLVRDLQGERMFSSVTPVEPPGR